MSRTHYSTLPYSFDTLVGTRRETRCLRALGTCVVLPTALYRTQIIAQSPDSVSFLAIFFFTKCF
jgi:hypothetical protein